MMRPASDHAATLQVSVGQHTCAGRKAGNQDFHGVSLPASPLRSTKGIALAVADGISSSKVSHIASETAVASFLEDYYCTPETWSVKKSAHKVMSATNTWLHSQTRQRQHHDRDRDQDRGYICTMSALILRATTAHVLHIGDARIYRLRGDVLTQLTDDHRVYIAHDKSYLGRAMGMAPNLDIDFHTVAIEAQDVFVLATDGVYEHIQAQDIVDALAACAHSLDAAARHLVRLAHERGSEDNLTIQIARIDALPQRLANELAGYAAQLPCPPLLDVGERFEGFEITETLHASSRSHVYLARDMASQDQVVIKIPSLDLRHDPAYLERLLTEEWIARRIDSRHVVRAWSMPRQREHLYTVSEYIPGQTLAQWMNANPRPALEPVIALIEQIARGLQAFHRLDIVHQDLRPENILITSDGTAKIIDLGAAATTTDVGGHACATEVQPILGTAQYAAPEYFLGESGTPTSDIYSLAAILYHMLSGRLPYGPDVARARSRAAQMRLTYVSVLDRDRELPAWVDSVLSRALHPDPAVRTRELSEFTYALRHPDQAMMRGERLPLLERNPVAFWKGLSVLLGLALVALALKL